ncbi:uncharacterized protein LOC129740315 [Uranotaenia lowii]|uniref:uncharacterized protein LOC129740315 n=1 Tax=Uranotaenia lowii TaxID=190385 RepID=UPI0024796D76|nr:uncharacterized protein LOC129740315 [Uranotaenia lowii]
MGKRKAKQPVAANQQDKKLCLGEQVIPEQQANTDWNIESYRTQYEPEEHWELRRSFMERHQNWIPEDELVCLAQVFVNVELLRCRYPVETMARLKELSDGVADEYRNSRRNKLQRTFVSASDAAASKVQRKGPGDQVTKEAKGPIKFQAASSKRFQPVLPIRSLDDVYKNLVLMNDNFEQTQIEFNKLFNNTGNTKLEIVVVQNQGKVEAQIKCGHFLLAKAFGDGEKSAKKNVKTEFFKEMHNHCYKIKRNRNSVQMSSSSVERKSVDQTVDHHGRKIVNDFSENKIDKSNLGFKMLQKLGWSGGSLGSKNEGIIDPVNCQIRIGRQGLGGGTPAEKPGQGSQQKTGKIDTRNQSYNIDINFYRQIMRNFRDSGLDYDMVFSSEFTKEERALFHSMALQLQLKTRSYGKDEDNTRQFVLLGRKHSPHELLERILVEKDPMFCEMYQVDPPGPINSDS